MSKKILLVLLAVLFMAGTAFATDPGYRSSPGRGEIVQMPFQSDPPKRFRLVRFLGPLVTELAKDSIVVWDTTVDDGVTIATTTTSGDSSVAGIIVQTVLSQDTADNTAVEDIGLQNWTWLQTYGLSQVDLGSSGIATAGSAMGTSATAGGASLFVGNLLPSTQGYAGFFMDTAAAAGTDVECFVRTE